MTTTLFTPSTPSAKTWVKRIKAYSEGEPIPKSLIRALQRKVEDPWNPDDPKFRQ